MKISYLESVGSTQNYLKELIKEEKIELPHAIVADMQTDGIGSRGSSWSGMEGNLFLSFAIPLRDMPSDLKLESSSIYFAFILKETLTEFGSQVWLKWPNDFYVGQVKIGGMITTLVKESIICGVGLNLVIAPKEFGTLDITLSREELLVKYFENIKKNSSWKQVFSKYELEFYQSRNFFTHANNLEISLSDAQLQSDGSIISNSKRIFSLR